MKWTSSESLHQVLSLMPVKKCSSSYIFYHPFPTEKCHQISSQRSSFHISLIHAENVFIHGVSPVVQSCHRFDRIRHCQVMLCMALYFLTVSVISLFMSETFESSSQFMSSDHIDVNVVFDFFV